MIPKSTIEDIKHKADLVNVIGEYVSLRKRGKNYLGLCPFHGEKTPSFTVSPEKHLWHCFGCGEGGNIFDFIMKSEQMEFAEAVRFLGDKVGVFVEQSAGASGGFKRKLYDILEQACKFYQAGLDEEVGRRFLEKRKIDNVAAHIFRLGVTRPGWDNLLKHLISKGFEVEDVEKAGLIIAREQKGDYFDRFRNRLVFPVLDQHGRVLGFSGRTLSTDEPKYLNSPDCPVFIKGNQLFGLYNAREEIKKLRYAVLVEGNIDLIACVQAGVKNVVAPLGTSFTPVQGKLLARVADAVVIAFDSDKAGVMAAEKAAVVLRNSGLHVRIAQMEGHKDPDEYISHRGNEAFLKVIKHSLPALEFSIKRIIKKYNITSREGRVMAAHEVASVLAKESDQILQKEYIRAAAQWLSIDEVGLTQEVKSKGGQSRAVRRKAWNRIVEKPGSNVSEAEKCLLTLALQNKEALGHVRENVEIDLISDPQYRILFQKVLAGEDDALESKTARSLMLGESPVENIKETIEDCARTLKAYKLKNKMKVLRQQMADTEKANDGESLRHLQKDYHKLSEILRSLSR